MNLSGTINTFRLLYAPKLARPHVVLSQFNELTFPLSKCIVSNVKRLHGVDVPEPDIRAVVIDKDNCIAKPHALEVWPAYKEKWDQLIDEFGADKVLIVSNTSGAAGEEEQAKLLEKTLGVPVLRHRTKKPGCHEEVMKYFLNLENPPTVTHPSQIVVIGDRMLTDVMLGTFMGSWTIWLSRGTIKKTNAFTILEKSLYKSQNLFHMIPKFPQMKPQ